jgi:hypothetical protein
MQPGMVIFNLTISYMTLSSYSISNTDDGFLVELWIAFLIIKVDITYHEKIR